MAYDTNPTLMSARARQRAEDEGVPLARAGGLPSANAQSSLNQRILSSNRAPGAPAPSLQIQPQLSIPLYRGGSVSNSVRAAEARVESGRETLRDTEGDLFSSVVTVYLDVMRDTAIVELSRSNLNVLETNLQAVRDRFEVGDLTRTDVAQSEARLALARSQLQTSQSNLIGSKERFVQIVGIAPHDLVPPTPLPNLPGSADEATETALKDNPELEGAANSREAARYDVNMARAGRLPQLSATSNGNFQPSLGRRLPSGGGGALPGRTASRGTLSAGIQASIPIYQGGAAAARIRQAQVRESQAIKQQTGVERTIVAQARTSFSNWQAAQDVIASSRVAISANELSLEGVRAGNTVGTRTVLDILNAEQELLNSRVALVRAERDSYVAAFSLLVAMGRAGANDLGLEIARPYDPADNYRRVRNRISDWDGDPAPNPVATRTVSTPVQIPDR